MSANGGHVNLKQAARRLELHYMTVYRYVRQGRLEAVRQGSGWVVAEPALERLRAELAGARAVGLAPGRGAGTTVDWSDRLYRCLLAGDEANAWRVVRAALAAGRSVTYCYVDMLSGALATLGNDWAGGDISVADQHLATAVATRIVAQLGALSRRPGRSRGNVVFGAPTGELHALPVAIAADLVRLAGFDVLELGANAPPEAFALAAQRARRLVAVGIGVVDVELVPWVQATVDAVRAVDAQAPIIIGGQAAITVKSSELYGITAWAPDGVAAASLISDLARPRRHPSSAPTETVPCGAPKLAVQEGLQP